MKKHIWTSVLQYLLQHPTRNSPQFWYELVCGKHITWSKQFNQWNIPTVVGSIVVVGVLTHSALLHSVCDSKATQMKAQEIILILYWAITPWKQPKEFVVWKVKTKLITVYFKKFCSSYKNFNNRTRSGKPKTMDFKAVLQAIEANPMRMSWRISGEFGITQSSVVRNLYNLSKTIWNYCKIFDTLSKNGKLMYCTITAAAASKNLEYICHTNAFIYIIYAFKSNCSKQGINKLSYLTVYKTHFFSKTFF